MHTQITLLKYSKLRNGFFRQSFSLYLIKNKDIYINISLITNTRTISPTCGRSASWVLAGAWWGRTRRVCCGPWSGEKDPWSPAGWGCLTGPLRWQTRPTPCRGFGSDSLPDPTPDRRSWQYFNICSLAFIYFFLWFHAFFSHQICE